MRVTLLCIVLLQVAWAFHGELLTCLQRGQCGVTGICPYHLTETTNTLDGHIIRLSNQLAYSVNYSWTTLLTTDTTGDQPTKTEVDKGSYVLLPGSTRYVDTRQGGAHTLRLLVNGEAYAYLSLQGLEEVPSEGHCNPEQTCAYLLRVCFMNAIDPHCLIYAEFCNGFQIDTDSTLIASSSVAITATSSTWTTVWLIIVSIAFVIVFAAFVLYWRIHRAKMAAVSVASF